MKKVLLLAVISLWQMAVLGQKKYEMVVEKTDGTEIVTNVDDIVQVYFREISSDDPTTDDTTLTAVDLGLPSGTKWANTNLAVSESNIYGGYYSWGETSEKSSYSWSDYQYGTSDLNVVDIGNNISGTQYDVAQSLLGGSWQMPSYDDFMELLNNCTYEWTTQNDVKGGLFTSKINGNTIFLPAGGSWWDYKVHEVGKSGNYWSSSVSAYPEGSAFVLYFDPEGADIDDPAPRADGNNIRPVCK